MVTLHADGPRRDERHDPDAENGATLLVRQTAQNWRLRLTATAILSAVVLPAAMLRVIDGDEGYLLQAARLVSEGERPYIDFFFPILRSCPTSMEHGFRSSGADGFLAGSCAD